MNYQDLEHRIAPVFEKDLHQFHNEVCFQPNTVDENKWQQHFLNMIQSWNPLMIFTELEFGIWISTFRVCYLAALSEMQIRVLDIHRKEDVQRLIRIVCDKLKTVFTSNNFTETIKAKNEGHSKRINRYMEQYQQVMKFQHDVITVKLYCAYQTAAVPLISIFDVVDHIKHFESKLKNIPLLQAGCLFQYRKTFRVTEFGEYVCAFFFSFNRSVLGNSDNLTLQLNQLWIDITKGWGRTIDPNLPLPWDEEKDHVILMLEEMDDAYDDLNDMLDRKDFVLTGEKGCHLCMWPRGFQQYRANVKKGFII